MNDNALLSLFFQRDERALSETGQAHGTACRAVAYRLLGSAEDAEECWSDALYKAWNAIPPERPLHFFRLRRCSREMASTGHRVVQVPQRVQYS